MKFLPTLKAINWGKYAEIAISGLMILLFTLPHTVSYDRSMGYDWEYDFLIEDEISLIIYLPFALIWIAYLLWKATEYRKGLLLLLFCYGIGLCAWNYFAASMMFMDIAPFIGMVIPFLIFGCLVVLCWPYLPKPPKIEEEEEDLE